MSERRWIGAGVIVLAWMFGSGAALGDEAATAANTARRLFALGQGEAAIRALEAREEPELVTLRESIATAVSTYVKLRVAYDAGRHLEGHQLAETLRRAVPDPGNQYRQWADTAGGANPKKLAAHLAADAETLAQRGQRYEAARAAARARSLDPSSEAAAAVASRIEAQIRKEHASLLAKKGEIDKPQLRAKVLDQYRPLAMLVRTDDPDLVRMRDSLRYAGGKVPGDEVHRAEAKRLWGLGFGAYAGRLMAPAKSDRDKALRALILSVHGEYLEARRLTVAGETAKAAEVWRRMAARIPDPKNRYRTTAEAALGQR